MLAIKRSFYQYALRTWQVVSWFASDGDTQLTMLPGT
jgi:hypothetical protein